MRKITIIEHISLDGVIQAPGGPNEDPLAQLLKRPKLPQAGAAPNKNHGREECGTRCHLTTPHRDVSSGVIQRYLRRGRFLSPAANLRFAESPCPRPRSILKK
jgi:hypothetical protein